MSSRYAVAPAPPAGPGEQPSAESLDRYVAELGRWRMRRDHELRALDGLTRTHEERDALNDDITASLTLWHAIVQRHDLLMAAWSESERGEEERGWAGQLVWGVLEMPDGDSGALALPLPEALRLSDALAGSLRARVGADADDVPVDERLAALDEELQRVRESADAHDGPVDTGLTERLDEAATQLEQLRGRDDDGVMGEIGELGSQISSVDRDLIVAAANQAHERADREQAVAERDHLVARGEAVRALAEKALNAINPAPRLGIPDVTALGDVPEEDGELTTYVANLERVGRALDQAHSMYAAALAEYADLADRAERLASTLAGCGAPTSVDLAGMLTAAKECLHTRPADIRRAAALVAAQEAYLDQLRTDS